MWIVKDVEFHPRTLDFRDSDRGLFPTTALLADGVEIINALNLVDLNEDLVELKVCEHCGTPGCGGGNFVVLRRLGDAVVILPAFKLLEGSDWDLGNDGPPCFMAREGIPLIAGRVLADLRLQAPDLPALDRLPPISAREVALALQWEAPARVLGEFPDPATTRKELVLAVSREDPDPFLALDDLLQNALADRRLVTLLAGPTEPVTFYLDQSGYPEWKPLVFDGESYRLAAAPGMGILFGDSVQGG
jgi:hypothetical protein